MKMVKVEDNYLKSQLGKYNLADAAISKMNADFMVMAVSGVEDLEGYEQCDSARKLVKGLRTGVEKTRKMLKAESLEYGRRVDEEAKRITGQLEPIEAHLEKQVNIIKEHAALVDARKKEQERIKAQVRVDELMKYGKQVLFEYAAEMTGEEYRAKLLTARTEWQAAQDKKAEEERKFREEVARVEKIRVDQEEERKRLDEIKAKQEEETAKIKLEREKLEAEARLMAENRRIEVEREKTKKPAIGETGSRKALEPEKQKAIESLQSVRFLYNPGIISEGLSGIVHSCKREIDMIIADHITMIVSF
jgi:hypothetical protein